MTNPVSVKKYESFNREKVLANLRRMTADLATEKVLLEQNINVKVSPEKTISHEKD